MAKAPTAPKPAAKQSLPPNGFQMQLCVVNTESVVRSMQKAS